MRIVSLLPSATEIVYALGLGDSLVGVSHECDYPTDAQRKPKIIEPLIDSQHLTSQQIDSLVSEHISRGESLYRINKNALKEANPDLIITQDLCDVCAIGADEVLRVANQLGKPVEVLSLNPHSLQDVKDDVQRIAKSTGTSRTADEFVVELYRKASEVRRMTVGVPVPRVLCLEWLDPLMNAGHWIPEMVELAGGREKLASATEPSTYIHWDSVLEYDPEVIVLMPCGFTTPKAVLEAKHLNNLKEIEQVSAVRSNRVYATDGHNYFSRSGPRLFDALRILAQIIHPELFNEALNPNVAKCVNICEGKRTVCERPCLL